MTFNLAKINPIDLTGNVVTSNNRPFGSGNFADVWEGIHTVQGYRYPVAVKILRPSLLSDKHLKQKTKRKILREAKVWSTLVHPNVARFIGVYYVQDTQGVPIPRLVSVFYRNRTLKDYLVNNPNNRESLRKLFRQFLSGLEYLHDKKVIHGDLKPTNVLIDNSWNAVLADFGLSLVLDVSGFTTTNVKAVGTFRYMAPELMNPPNPLVTPRPTAQSDIWSAGMTGLEILSGVVPYVDKIQDGELIFCISKGDIPDRNRYDQVSSKTWSMLKTCWCEAKARPGVPTLIKSLNEIYPGLQ
ncbi:kinase-like domain-containing protein [Suillus discolor]|uniref:Kinase-like domain-containing protein n=1 Tax=Suillus discolor TaxID=1912936 RepID=A0A9P7JRP2_9AGAM|nr:kinase-like domain-containing protein [Suillus discolor]KAG2102838.1 kinase-like domain-containing protein [Suillus discolor]